MKLNFPFPVLIVLTALSLLSSCNIPRSYPDPEFHAQSPTSVQLKEPKVISLEVIGQRNGEVLKGFTKAFTKEFNRSFSKISNLKIGPGGGHVKIIANNFYDPAASAMEQLKLELTMGVMGIELTDNYEFTFTYEAKGSPSFSKSYKHAVHSIKGLTKLPRKGGGVMRIRTAFRIVLDDATRSFLDDLVRSGKL